jgi:uncharacterized protein YfaA (DUF2138 family)
MPKLKIPIPHDHFWLGCYEFHDDQLSLAGIFRIMDHVEDSLTLVGEVFEQELHEVIAAMWTFEQGRLTGDILHSRMAKFPLEKVWHAKYLVGRFHEIWQDEFCRAIHILDRLKPPRQD